MKNLFIVFTLLISLNAFGSTISFQCKNPNVNGIHKFEAKGLLSIDDESNLVTGFITLQVQKFESTASILVFEDIAIHGSIRHFEKGQGNSEPFDHLVLVTTEPYLKSINLLLGYKAESASSILSIDNFLYRANCELLDSTRPYDQK